MGECLGAEILISIHAPPRGATQYFFQLPPFARSISIHAPPRGATRYHSGLHPQRADFNSRPSARGDLTTKHMAHRRKYFNSRPSARGDCTCTGACGASTLFQFTPLREGRHYLLGNGVELANISIHAPPRGATSDISFILLSLRNFNSRPSARGDRARYLQ